MRYIATVLLIPILIYFLQPTLDAIFLWAGLDGEAWAKTVVHWLQSLTEALWFWNATLICLGAVFGAIAYSQIEKLRHRNAAKFKALSPRITELKDFIWAKAQRADGSYAFAAPDRQLKDKLSALFSELRGAGVKTPDLGQFEGASFSLLAEHYLAAIEPYSVFGQVDKASEAGIAKFVTTVEAFKAMADGINQD